MSKAYPYTKAMITTMLLSIQRVEESILELDSKQSPVEQQIGTSVYRNKKGWNFNPKQPRRYTDAAYGSSFAKQLRTKGSGCLSGKQLAKARKMLPKYWRQLQGVYASWEAAKQQAAVKPKPVTPKVKLTVEQCMAEVQDCAGPNAIVKPTSNGGAEVTGIRCHDCGFICDWDASFCGLCGCCLSNEQTQLLNPRKAILPCKTTNMRIVVPGYLLKKYSNRRMNWEIGRLTDSQVVAWLAFEANVLRRKDEGKRTFWDGRGSAKVERTVMAIKRG
jgi:hypothetical protein